MKFCVVFHAAFFCLVTYLFFQRERIVCGLHTRLYADCEGKQNVIIAKRKVLSLTKSLVEAR